MWETVIVGVVKELLVVRGEWVKVIDWSGERAKRGDEEGVEMKCTNAALNAACHKDRWRGRGGERWGERRWEVSARRAAGVGCGGGVDVQRFRRVEGYVSREGREGGEGGGGGWGGGGRGR